MIRQGLRSPLLSRVSPRGLVAACDHEFSWRVDRERLDPLSALRLAVGVGTGELIARRPLHYCDA